MPVAVAGCIPYILIDLADKTSVLVSAYFRISVLAVLDIAQADIAFQ